MMLISYPIFVNNLNFLHFFYNHNHKVAWNKNISRISKGKYYKPFFKGITVLDSKKYDYKYIYNATKAQKCFNGITINGKKYYDVIFYSKEKVSKLNRVIVCKNNKKLILVKRKWNAQ